MRSSSCCQTWSNWQHAAATSEVSALSPAQASDIGALSTWLCLTGLWQRDQVLEYSSVVSRTVRATLYAIGNPLRTL